MAAYVVHPGKPGKVRKAMRQPNSKDAAFRPRYESRFPDHIDGCRRAGERMTPGTMRYPKSLTAFVEGPTREQSHITDRADKIARAATNRAKVARFIAAGGDPAMLASWYD